MFAYVREHGADYDRVCFNVRSAWYGIHAYIRFYLEGDPIQTIDNTYAAACALPGTMQVIDMNHLNQPPNFQPLTEIRDIDDNGFTEIYGRSK